MKEVVIVSAVDSNRSFGGCLSSVSATSLGGFAIKGLLDKVNLSTDKVMKFLGMYFANLKALHDKLLWLLTFLKKCLVQQLIKYVLLE